MFQFLPNIFLIILGLIFLVIAGDLLVRGAGALAAKLNVPRLLISLTIVAFGTSAPELVVTIGSVMSGNEGIAMGNIIGSNIANVLLVLGLPAIIAPIAFTTPGLQKHAIALTIATTVFMFFAYAHGLVDTLAGIVLFGLIILYVFYTGISAMRTPDGDPTLEDVDDFIEDDAKWKLPVYLIAGLIGLPLGAHLLVHNGAYLASAMGVRDELIGLTIVAFGTSLPELATVWAAALRKQADIAVGNILGSNIFNLLCVGGAAGLVGTSTFTSTALQIDLPMMVISSMLLIALVFMKGRINRLLGIILFVSYLVYILFIGLNSGML